MDRVSSKLSLLASVGMFEPLLCLGVETRSWQKKRGSWLGELGRCYCPCRWEAGAGGSHLWGQENRGQCSVGCEGF